MADRDVPAAGSGEDLWKYSRTLRPFGPSAHPWGHYNPVDAAQAARVMPGEQCDPRFASVDSPAGPTSPAPVLEDGDMVGFTAPLPQEA
jgi:hypothetical protein